MGGELGEEGVLERIPYIYDLDMMFNPILQTWFRDSCFTFDVSSTIQGFPVLFNIGMVI